LWDGCYMHQVESLWGGPVLVHIVILSLAESFGLSGLHANQLESQKASLSLLPRRVVERSREETHEKRVLVLGKALQCAGVYLLLKGWGYLLQRSTSLGQKNALHASVARVGLALYQLRACHTLDQPIHGRSLKVEEFL